MQQVTFNINEEADLPFLKKLLESLNGVSGFMVEKKSAEEMSDAEYDQKFSQLLDKSFEQFEEGKFQEATPEFLNRAFRS